MRETGQILRGILDSMTDRPEVLLVFLEELWPQLAGEELARHVRPMALSGGVLRLAVPDKVWAEQLKCLSPLLLSRINGFWGRSVVETIDFEFDLSR
jgi:predicted nucleic acid-binding Zn ribbon protein